MQQKTTGIILSLSDYRDNDKMAKLFSDTHGKINIVFRGVKKQGAKLRHAAMPFCFGNFELQSGKGAAIVTGCEVVDSFFSLAEDYDKYETGIKILKICDSVSPYDVPNAQLLVLALRFLKELAYGEINTEILYLRFLYDVICLCGRKPSFLSACAFCGNENSQSKYFDLSKGGIVCYACAPTFSKKLSWFAATVLRTVCSQDLERLSFLSFEEPLTEAIDILENAVRNLDT